MTLTAEEKILARHMLKTDEGTCSRPYDDATGKPVVAKGKVTLGVGHNCNAKPLPQAVIDLLLDLDIDDAVREAIGAVGENLFNSLTTNRRLALVNLAFNLGGTGLAKFKQMIAALKVHDYAWAGAHLRDSLWAIQVDPKQQPNAGRDDRVIRLITEDYYAYPKVV